MVTHTIKQTNSTPTVNLRPGNSFETYNRINSYLYIILSHFYVETRESEHIQTTTQTQILNSNNFSWKKNEAQKNIRSNYLYRNTINIFKFDVYNLSSKLIYTILFPCSSHITQPAIPFFIHPHPTSPLLLEHPHIQNKNIHTDQIILA